jgi:ketosteroid isomerase-like protein
MTIDDTLLARIEAIEADIAIRNLVARYAFVMDDRDCDAIPDLFTRDARVWTGDGHMDARGRDALVELYEGRFAVLGATNHVVTSVWIEIDGPTQAHGRISSNAEVWRNGLHQLASLRYEDRYKKEDGAWRVAERKMLYFYYVPLEEHPGILGTTKRNLTYDTPIEADVPEKTPGFVKYLATH